MSNVSRRRLLALGVGVAAGAGMAGCGSTTGEKGPAGGPGDAAPPKTRHPAKGPERAVRLLGDGSMSDTGTQPNQPSAPVPLEPGQTPPQFVILSWDGAGEVGNDLFPRFLNLAR